MLRASNFLISPPIKALTVKIVRAFALLGNCLYFAHKLQKNASFAKNTQLAYSFRMKLVFFETPVFTRYLFDYLSEEGYRDLQNALLNNPECGDVIQGTGGFRKMRWFDDRRKKGKRGGLRIIYYYFLDYKQIWFFTIYDKEEMENLSATEKKLLKQAITNELAIRKGEKIDEKA